MTTETTGTARQRPDERFAQPAAMIDLRQAANELAREGDDGRTPGHRQVTLYKHGAATLALFRFEQGAGLPEHKADGTVIIQVIEGALTVAADGSPRRLTPGELLVLAPGVRHDVRADEQSLMLLTVSLERP